MRFQDWFTVSLPPRDSRVLRLRYSYSDGQAVSRLMDNDKSISGSRCGPISGISGAIPSHKDKTANVVSDDESQYFIVNENVGGYYLIGRAGLEPATKAL